ncbi:MAG: phosphogluconate dehydratase [Alphaproteobacteria bacterium]|nr:phosphogluconate dehydratase [Alphaproteobacteria bacterium]
MSAPLHPVLGEVTARIAARSADTRAAYLELVASRRPPSFARKRMADSNLAHVAAACPAHDKAMMLGGGWPNIGIVTAYNDMLSAHQPFERFPELIRAAARTAGATAQVAGGVPAMCDGVTQGAQGMELSLLSRDVIAMGAAVALSHDAFDAALYLGVCDKIVPGLVIAALRFGWLPALFTPAGPMPSGLPNPEKARIRQLFAEGKVDRAALLQAESESYHAPGTCTFYGTANSNQMLMEMLGLHLPGAAFVPPNTPLRDALTRAATVRAAAIHAQGSDYRPVGPMIDARAIVNAIVGLMATGGSTNHALHIPAMANAAGLVVTWDDFADLSRVTPLMCRVYPNGAADVNHFHAAGGMAFVVRELIAAGLVHADVETVAGPGLARYAQEPGLDGETLVWRPGATQSGDREIVREVADPFDAEGGLKLLSGPLGRAIVKTSAVKPQHRTVEAPARVFDSQDDLLAAFKTGELDRDVVCVVRFQGPRANGMPELHKMTPALASLQDRGFKVALVTDGRMSGASGKIPAAIHVTPEAVCGGALARLQDGDVIRLDCAAGGLEVKVDPAAFAARAPAAPGPAPTRGLGREMFSMLRLHATDAEAGGSVFGAFD